MTHFNKNGTIHVVLIWQVAAASTVHFYSIFIAQQYSVVSSVPSIILAPIPYPSSSVASAG